MCRQQSLRQAGRAPSRKHGGAPFFDESRRNHSANGSNSWMTRRIFERLCPSFYSNACLMYESPLACLKRFQK